MSANMQYRQDPITKLMTLVDVCVTKTACHEESVTVQTEVIETVTDHLTVARNEQSKAKEKHGRRP